MRRGGGPDNQFVKLIILGRDGILNEYRDDHVKAPAEWVPIPGALEAVSRLNHAGWHAVVATNQAGIGRGMIDMASVNLIHAHMNKLMQAQGARLDAVFFCPHTPEEQCECRKPLPGMMLEIGERYGVDLDHVPVAADTLRDLQAAHAAGCEPHLVRTGRAAHLDDAVVEQWCRQVPGVQVHADLSAMAEQLIARDQRVPATRMEGQR